MKPLYTKKNGTSQRVAAIEVKMPASYPSANVSYGNGSVEDALDDLNDDVVEYYDYAVTMYTSGNVSPFTYYGNVDISAFASGKRILSAQPIVTGSAQRAIATINNTQTTAYVYGTDSSNIVLRVAAKKA